VEVIGTSDTLQSRAWSPSQGIRGVDIPKGTLNSILKQAGLKT